MLLRRTKMLEVKHAEEVEVAVQTTTLESESNLVSCVISLNELVVAGCKDGKVRVYDRDITDAALAVFTEHHEGIVCLARLEDDIVVSVDANGQMYTWCPSTTETIGSWKDVERSHWRAVAKLDDQRLVVSIGNGNLAVLAHTRGANLKMEKQLRRKRHSWVRGICVANNRVVSCSFDRNVDVWSRSTFNHLATLRAKGDVSDVAANDTHIVMVCSEGCIYAYHNAPPFPLDFTLRTPYSELNAVVNLDPDTVAMASYPGCVSLVSLSSKSLVARTNVSKRRLISLTVLGDNLLAAVADVGVCTMFRPPQLVQRAVVNYTPTLHDVDLAPPEIIRPLFDAWNSVQEQSLSLLEACETVICTENTATSLDEWCIAHDLLMQAVNTGIVPRSRDYYGTKLHWHRELYQHCDKLGIGEKDIDFLVSLFREAEEVGVIAEGTSESFIYAVGIRNDIDKDKWYSANAIYQLFLRQAEADTRLQQVLHYQKVQQLTSLINAVLGFVPIGGAIAANAIWGGAAILQDFQIYGLVESLMGVGKDLTGRLGSDKLVDLFVRRGNEVLSRDHWDEWGEENRQAVEDAAQCLGLTVKELRHRLLRVSQMMNDEHACHQEENWPEVIEEVEETEADSYVGYETRGIEIANAPPPVVSNVEVLEQNADLEEARGELKKWANEPLDKALITKLKYEEAATCLASYLVNHCERQIGNYIRLKEALLDVFLEQFIDGSLFVHAEGKEREELIQSGMSAIERVVDSRASRNLGIRLRLFVRQFVQQ